MSEFRPLPAPAPGAPAPQQGAVFEASVEDVTRAGEGVVRLGRLVVFTPAAVPGDRVLVRITDLGPRRARGEVVRIVAPAAARRSPPCPHQPACGGCPLMVLEPGAALALKVRQLEQALRRIGGVAPPPVRTVAAPEEFGYRGRVRFSVAPRESGASLGHHPRGQARAFVPISACWLAPERAIALGRALIERLNWCTPAGGLWPHAVSVLASFARGEWLLALHTAPGRWPLAVEAAVDLMRAAPDLVGVVRLIESPGRAPREQALAGADRVRERIGPVEVELTATTFLQVNPRAAALLYDEVRAALAGPPAPRRLLDLYAGAGLVGLLAAPQDAEVLGVERSRRAVELARRAAVRAGRQGFRVLAGDATAAARRLADGGERFDRVTLNPPRAGVGRGAAAAVAALGARVVVMVSCHPAALARDVMRFAAAGFELTDVSAVDMFPQTPHLEAVARLEARATRSD